MAVDIAARRREHGDDFTLARDVAAAYFDHFEGPSPEEGPLLTLQPED